MCPQPLVIASNISKHYGGVAALSEVSLSAPSGEIHALLGENGAGKSTLVKTFTGAVAPSAGQLQIDGITFTRLNPSVARGLGIAAVTQELSLIPVLTGAENLWFPDEPVGRLRGRDRKEMLRRSEEVLENAGLPSVALNIPVSELGIGPRQILEIAKAVARKPRILILDEATSALGPAEVERVLLMVRRLAKQGVLCFYISHRIAEVKEIANRITVLRGGRSVGTFVSHEVDDKELIRHIIGKPLNALYPKWDPTAAHDIALEVEGVSAGHHLSDVSFTIRRGEVLGVGGLQDQGQLQLFLRLFGVMQGTGRIRIGGREVRLRHPRVALAAGIGCAYIPEDRQEEGLLLSKSVRENLVMTRLASVSRFGLIQRSAEAKLSRQLVTQFSINTKGIEQHVGTLSGGNQQKVLVAKYILPHITTFLWYDPTRGVDVGAKQEMFSLMRRQAAEGKAVLFYSTDSDELTHLCDRVIVLSYGQIVATLDHGELGDESLMRAAFALAPTKQHQ